MEKEEKELLLHLLKKIDEDGLLNIYDEKEHNHEVISMFLDREELCIKIKK